MDEGKRRGAFTEISYPFWQCPFYGPIVDGIRTALRGRKKKKQSNPSGGVRVAPRGTRRSKAPVSLNE